ncbi:MAG: right-handed parallel beta-helix repeat-containing protein, partial [Chloroflexi bacterium]|nr:right-handed parallel beta-helix repeat-containing protein [Chloroflexota bacterium]
MKLIGTGRRAAASAHFFLVAGLLLAPWSPCRAAASPVAFWVSQPVRPGETALVFGSGFAGCGQVRVARAPDTPARLPLPSGVGDAPDVEAAVTASPLANWPSVSVRPAQVDSPCVKFVLPAGDQPGVFLSEIETPGGRATVWINRPKILWAQGDAGQSAGTGGFIRVVGTCLAVPGRAPLLLLDGPGGRLMLQPSSAAAFSLQAQIPTSTTPGSYRLSVHSGCGGRWGWSRSIPFTILARGSAPSRTFRLPAKGPDQDDTGDDTDALQKALNALGAAGGVLALPRGRFLVRGQLTIPPGVTLEGAGEGLTALCWPDTPTPPPALIGGSHGFSIRDLTLYATNHRNGIQADQNGPEAGHVRILHVRLRLDPYRGHLTREQVNERLEQAQKLSSGGGDSLRLGGSDVEVAGCDVYGGGRCLYLSGGRGCWIHDNDFYNGRWGWYSLSGNDGVIFERNQISGADLMSTGGGINCLDGSNVSQNVYYAHNSLKTMFGWDREAMTTDAGGGAYYGQAASAAGAALTLGGDPAWGRREWTGAGVFILDGTGAGQYRQIVRVNGRQVDVDRPWAVMPDASSVVTITMLQRNYLFIDNTFTDAGVAIQMYGTSIGSIASGNTSVRTGGFHNFGMNYDGIQPSWFVQWLDNRIVEGNVYGGGHDQSVASGEAHLGVFALPPGKQPAAPLTLACIVRGNILENNAHLAVGGSDPPDPAITYPYVQEVVVEHNRVEHSAEGLVIARAASGVFARSNEFIDCGVGMVDQSEEQAQLARLLEKMAKEPGPLLHLDFTRPAETAFEDISTHRIGVRCIGTCTSV